MISKDLFPLYSLVIQKVLNSGDIIYGFSQCLCHWGCVWDVAKCASKIFLCEIQHNFYMLKPLAQVLYIEMDMDLFLFFYMLVSNEANIIRKNASFFHFPICKADLKLKRRIAYKLLVRYSMVKALIIIFLWETLSR